MHRRPFRYAVIHKPWLAGQPSALARAQFIVHQAGAAIMFAGLLLLFGNAVPAAQQDPMLALASITVLLGSPAHAADGAREKADPSPNCGFATE